MTFENIKSRKIILYGINKFQEDFEMFFQDIQVKLYLEDEYSEGEYKNKAVYTISEFSADKLGDSLIIICDFNYEEKKKNLEKLGLVQETHFVLGTDIIKWLDDEFEYVNKVTKEQMKDKKIIVMGTGVYFGYLINDIPELQISYFIDNNEKKWGTEFRGKEIKPVNELLNEEKGKFLLFVASSSVVEINAQLTELGFELYIDYVFYEKIKIMPSELLYKTMKDKRITNYICDLPYNMAIVEVSGDVFNCRCSAWINLPSGNLRRDSYEKILNSTYAKIFRLSVLNGTYSFCDSNQCYLLNENLLQKNINETKIQQKYFVKTDKYPDVVAATYDFSCNLACKSCRREHQFSKSTTELTMKQIHENFKNTLSPHINTLFLAGNGEVFFSKYYLDLLENYDGKNIVLQSNGILFSEKIWEKIKGRFERVDFYCSIDAANKETYKKLRGADFDLLLKNLRFVSELKKKNEISVFKINFVAQADNFREIVDFAKLGIDLGVDEVYYCKLLNIGAFTDEEMSEGDVFNPAHKHHSELLEILKDPILEHPCINLGNLTI